MKKLTQVEYFLENKNRKKLISDQNFEASTPGISGMSICGPEATTAATTTVMEQQLHRHQPKVRQLPLDNLSQLLNNLPPFSQLVQRVLQVPVTPPQ